MSPGPTNSLTDVAGLRVGHAQARAPGSLTGTTVVLTPPGGAVGGVDVRGAAPGTRETDLLDPHRLVERVHAVVLTGGSAYGLAAVDGVMTRLEAAGVGHPVAGGVVPIVPAAVVFDLGRGGDFGTRPGPAMGAAAYDDAIRDDHGAGPRAVPQGVVGAGTGAVAGGLKGGVGSASAVLPDAFTVAALVVLNAAGTAVDPGTGELYATRYGLAGEFDHLRRPATTDVATWSAGAGRGAAPDSALQATTLAVLATDAALSPAQTQLLAQMGADGLARAARPVHTLFDGDTTFALATGTRAAPALTALHQLLGAAADCVSRAVGHALLAAETVRTPAGRWRCYTEAFPSALDR